MAEIKSTLELALERTKRFEISKKEREEIKQRELLKKMDSIFNRYKEGSLPLSDFLKEIERTEEETRNKLKENLINQLIEALSLKEEGERILKGIEALKEKDIEEIKEKFHLLISKYQRERNKVFWELKSQLKEELKRGGIWGSAVEPNVEGSNRWDKASAEIDKNYSERLKEIKEELRIS